jgi:hypothetical protein
VSGSGHDGPVEREAGALLQERPLGPAASTRENERLISVGLAPGEGRARRGVVLAIEIQSGTPPGNCSACCKSATPWHILITTPGPQRRWRKHADAGGRAKSEQPSSDVVEEADRRRPPSHPVLRRSK